MQLSSESTTTVQTNSQGYVTSAVTSTKPATGTDQDYTQPPKRTLKAPSSHVGAFYENRK